MYKIFSNPTTPHHKNAETHPECPERLIRLHHAFTQDFSAFLNRDIPTVDLNQCPKIHDEAYFATLFGLATQQSHQDNHAYIQIDSDTALSNGTLNALEQSLGFVTSACKQILDHQAKRIFIASRPPGHHAEHDKAMGFCFINWAYLAASILHKETSKKVLIIDFDVHHGNGTEDLILKHKENQNIYYASLHETPLFPDTGLIEHPSPQILNIPYPPHTKSVAFQNLVDNKLIPFLEQTAPEFIIISAGFDAHYDDPLSTAKLCEDDFERITRLICATGCPVISILEGGYNLDALENCVNAHLEALFDM